MFFQYLTLWVHSGKSDSVLMTKSQSLNEHSSVHVCRRCYNHQPEHQTTMPITKPLSIIVSSSCVGFTHRTVYTVTYQVLLQQWCRCNLRPVILFKPIYQLGQPDYYLYLLYQKISSGSKDPKNMLFHLNHKITVCGNELQGPVASLATGYSQCICSCACRTAVCQMFCMLNKLWNLRFFRVSSLGSMRCLCYCSYQK